MINIFKERKEAKNIRETWLQTLVNSKCTIKNTDGAIKTFDLLEIKKTKFGVRGISLIPYGLAVSDLEGKKEKLQDALDAYISIEKKPFTPHIFVNVVTKQPCFDFEPVKALDNKFFLGYKPYGEPHFADLNINNNFLIAGMRGTGKTMYSKALITNCMHFNKDIDFYFLQIKKDEVDIFANCTNTKKIAKTAKEAKDVLKNLNKEIDIRAKQLAALGNNVDTISKYNRKSKKKMKRIFVVVEELSFFMEAEGKDAVFLKECWKEMRDIAKAGRSVGIGLIGITQRATAENLDPNLKAQLNSIVFRLERNIDSVNIIDSNDAVTLEDREMICKIGGYEKLIAPEIDEDYECLLKHLPIEEKEVCQLSDGRFDIKEIKEVFSQKKQMNITEDEMKIIRESKYKLTVEQIRAGITIIEDEKIQITEEKVLANTTDRDKKILKFIEAYGAVTINQVNSIFFNSNKSIESCRRRLKDLEKKGLLQSDDLVGTKQKQYFNLEQKGKKLHESYIIDFYCKLVSLGAEIQEFKTEHHLLEGALRPDSFIQYKYNNKTCKSYIEIDYTHYTSQYKISQYEQYQSASKENFNVIIAKNDKLQVKSERIQLVHTSLNFKEFTI